MTDCTQRPFPHNLDVNTSVKVFQYQGSRWKTIPTAFGGFVELISLNLDNNCLEILDQDCFINLQHLSCISLSHNQLTEITDHIFDNNEFLRYIDFSKNNIRTIGLHVFSNSTNLKNLEMINLRDNELTHLEP
ncbi:hypothetical protein CAPTEDRAFT_129441, partial [Capitella teleta]